LTVVFFVYPEMLEAVRLRTIGKPAENAPNSQMPASRVILWLLDTWETSRHPAMLMSWRKAIVKQRACLTFQETMVEMASHIRVKT
jgi:hypothetical protein